MCKQVASVYTPRTVRFEGVKSCHQSLIVVHCHTIVLHPPQNATILITLFLIINLCRYNRLGYTHSYFDLCMCDFPIVKTKHLKYAIRFLFVDDHFLFDSFTSSHNILDIKKNDCRFSRSLLGK